MGLKVETSYKYFNHCTICGVSIYDGKYLPRDQPATAVAFKLFFYNSLEIKKSRQSQG